MIGSRTQISNQIRGLLGEYGIVLSQHLSQVRKALPQLADEHEKRLSAFAKRLFATLYEELQASTVRRTYFAASTGSDQLCEDAIFSLLRAFDMQTPG